MRIRTQRFVMAGLIAAVYLYAFPYFSEIRSANELPRIYLVQAMLDEGTVAIDSGVERWGKTVDVSPSGGHYYSNKAPGSSILAVPAYLGLKWVKGLSNSEPSLAEMTWAFRVFTGVLPTLLFLVLLWRFLRRFAPMPETRRLIVVGYAIGTMAMAYSVLFIAHQLAAICIGTAYILAVWVSEEDTDPRWLWACGLAAGAAPLVDYQAAFAGVPIALYLIAKLLRRPKGRRHLAYAVGGAVLPIATLLLYHNAAFGSPLKTGYDASTAFAHFHQQGFLGMDGFRGEAFWGSLFAADNGLFIFSPFLLLAFPGWYLMARKRQFWHLGITLSVFLIYVAFISSINFWRGGWQLGPRYITAILPFMMVPVASFAAWADRRFWARALVVGLVGASAIIYTLSCMTFPHFPEKFANPLYELVFRLLLEGRVAPNAGYLIGLRGSISLIPYLMILAGLWYWVTAHRAPERRSALLGTALAVALVGAYSWFPHGGHKADQAYDWVSEVMLPDASE